MRGRLALHASGVPYEHRELVLRDKPEAFLQTSPKGTVPVFVTYAGAVLEQSLDLMFWALRENDPENWLKPATETLESAAALIAQNDGDFKYHLDRYKYSNRYDGVDRLEHRARGETFIRALEERLRIGEWLSGPRACIADYAIAPFIRQFANTDREWFDAQDWPGVHRWLARILDSERFKTIMKKYPLWTPDAPQIYIP